MVQILVFLITNFILWGIAAGIYNRGSGVNVSGDERVEFILSAVSTLPEIGSVIPHIWTNHTWYVLVCLVVETLLVLFLLWMRKIDKELSSGKTMRRR